MRDRSAPGCFGGRSQHRVEQVLGMVSRYGLDLPERLGDEAMKLGLQLGYWGAQPPANAPELVAAAEEAGLRHRVHRGGVGVGRVHATGVVGLRNTPDAAGHVGGAALRAYPDRLRDGLADLGSPVRRAAHPGAGCVGTAGRRGLVRPEVSQAAGPHPRVHRHHPAGAGRGRSRCPATARTTRCR